jgi:hypothetical protein
VSQLTDSVRKRPVESFLPIFINHFFLFSFWNFLMETYVYKALLVKVGFVSFTHKFFAASFHAESNSGLNEGSPWWKVSLSLHLFQILLHFRLVCRVWNFIYVIIQNISEFSLAHSVCEIFKLIMAHFYFFTINQGVIYCFRWFKFFFFLSFIIFFWFNFNAVKIFRCIWIEWHF